jgi:hypothetical protein
MKIQPKVIVIGLMAIIILAGGGVLAASALRQPDVADFKRLDSQREAVDTSMNIYSPLFSGYSTEYANVLNEKRSADEQVALKDQYVKSFETEYRVNTDRLNAMRSSLALKEQTVRAAFDTYDTAYRAVVEYYRQYALNVANIAEPIAGKCDLNSDLNVGSATLAEDYTKAADSCLAALSVAKETSDEPTKKLLGDVENLVKQRRDAFKKAIGKEGFEQTATKTLALITLLGINSELETIQSDYETVAKTEYTKLVNRANESNESLKAALKPHLSEEGTEA